jgi:hypothetical protein
MDICGRQSVHPLVAIILVRIYLMCIFVLVVVAVVVVAAVVAQLLVAVGSLIALSPPCSRCSSSQSSQFPQEQKLLNCLIFESSGWCCTYFQNYWQAFSTNMIFFFSSYMYVDIAPGISLFSSWMF